MPLRVALLGLLALGCIPGLSTGSITVTQPPAVIDPPIPDRFEGDATPPLEATEAPGLARAPSVHEHLYFYEPDGLWYRWAYNRWYQAFAWDGNWFVPERVPGELAGREPVRTLPGLMPLDPNGLPTLDPAP